MEIYERVLVEAFGGDSDRADARGPRREGRDLAPQQPSVPDPEDPSLWFKIWLIDRVYEACAQGVRVDMGSELEDVAWFDLPDDPKTRIAVLCVHKEARDVGYLAFRGTVGAREWTIDMRFRQTEAGVHRGFSDAYESIGERLKAAVGAAGLRRLFVMGHSMGGALAVLAGAELGACDVTTFGCPRIGSAAWARTFETHMPPVVLHVRDEGDVVPAVPFVTMPIPFLDDPDYRHVGRWLLFRSDETTLSGCHSTANYLMFAKEMDTPIGHREEGY